MPGNGQACVTAIDNTVSSFVYIMSKSKSVPLEPVCDSPGPSETYSYPQPTAAGAGQTPSTEQPWWAESDYIPPYIQQFVEANAGLSLVCAAQLFFALMNVTVKYFISSTDISIPSLILVRQAITAIGCVSTLTYINEPHPFLGPPELRRLLLARGLFGFGALVSTYESFQGLSVSDTTAIQFLTPSVLVILGYFFLREKPTAREITAGALCLCGVMLVSRPPFIFGDIEQEVEVPPGRVNLPPGQDEVDDGMSISRAAGVAWAFASVLGSSVACESIGFLWTLTSLILDRPDHPYDRQTRTCATYHGLLCIYLLYCNATVCRLGLHTSISLTVRSVVLFVPGQGQMPKSFKGFFFIILIGVSEQSAGGL